jgi:hypothetical protein
LLLVCDPCMTGHLPALSALASISISLCAYEICDVRRKCISIPLEVIRLHGQRDD